MDTFVIVSCLMSIKEHQKMHKNFWLKVILNGSFLCPLYILTDTLNLGCVTKYRCGEGLFSNSITLLLYQYIK